MDEIIKARQAYIDAARKLGLTVTDFLATDDKETIYMIMARLNNSDHGYDITKSKTADGLSSLTLRTGDLSIHWWERDEQS